MAEGWRLSSLLTTTTELPRAPRPARARATAMPPRLGRRRARSEPTEERRADERERVRHEHDQQDEPADLRVRRRRASFLDPNPPMAGCGVKPNQTKQNQIKPNLTKPNQTNQTNQTQSQPQTDRWWAPCDPRSGVWREKQTMKQRNKPTPADLGHALAERHHHVVQRLAHPDQLEAVCTYIPVGDGKQHRERSQLWRYSCLGESARKIGGTAPRRDAPSRRDATLRPDAPLRAAARRAAATDPPPRARARAGATRETENSTRVEEPLLAVGSRSNDRMHSNLEEARRAQHAHDRHEGVFLLRLAAAAGDTVGVGVGLVLGRAEDVMEVERHDEQDEEVERVPVVRKEETRPERDELRSGLFKNEYYFVCCPSERASERARGDEEAKTRRRR